MVLLLISFVINNLYHISRANKPRNLFTYFTSRSELSICFLIQSLFIQESFTILELSIMSSYGENREFTQIFNKYDPCCFAGLKYEYYEVELQQIIANLGKGNFSVISDDTHNERMISDFSLELIEKNLKK